MIQLQKIVKKFDREDLDRGMFNGNVSLCFSFDYLNFVLDNMVSEKYAHKHKKTKKMKNSTVHDDVTQ